MVDQRIGRQGGWLGLIGMFLALAIVAWLVRDALRAYLSLPSPPTVTTETGTPGAAARAAGGIGPADIDVSSPTVAPQTAIDRARGVEDMAKRGAEQQANQIDGAVR
jgi:hypothetical protein